MPVYEIIRKNKFVKFSFAIVKTIGSIGRRLVSFDSKHG